MEEEGGRREVSLDCEDVVVGYGEECEEVAMEGTCHGREEEKELVEFLHKKRGWIVRSLGSCVDDA